MLSMHWAVETAAAARPGKDNLPVQEVVQLDHRSEVQGWHAACSSAKVQSQGALLERGVEECAEDACMHSSRRLHRQSDAPAPRGRAGQSQGALADRGAQHLAGYTSRKLIHISSCDERPPSVAVLRPRLL
jgi:hypothetical protein